MKRVIIIVLILLVVAGGGAGGLMMLGIVHNPFRPAAKAPDLEAQEAAAAEAKAKAAHLPTENLKMVKIPDMVIPVLGGQDSTRRIFINIRLVTNGNTKDVKAATGQYEDAVLSDLIPYFQDYFRDHDLLDIDLVKSKLQKHAQDVFGNMVTDVLFVNVFETGGLATDSTRSVSED